MTRMDEDTIKAIRDHFGCSREMAIRWIAEKINEEIDQAWERKSDADRMIEEETQRREDGLEM